MSQMPVGLSHSADDSEESEVDDAVVAVEYGGLFTSSSVDIEEDLEESDLQATLSAYIDDESADIGSFSDVEDIDEDDTQSAPAPVTVRSLIPIIFVS
jgi:hypothetical protein